MTKNNTSLVIHNNMNIADLGDVLVKSRFFADTQQAAQAIVKVLAGQELGFGPIASMTGVNIIKGRVTLSANLMAAAIKRTEKYNYRIREHTNSICKIEFFEVGDSVGISEFTLEDAKKAQLVKSGGNWSKYPKNMLFARALSNGAKFYCPDIFGGPVYTPDELGAAIDGETGEIIEGEWDEQPQPAPSPPQPHPAVIDDHKGNADPREDGYRDPEPSELDEHFGPPAQHDRTRNTTQDEPSGISNTLSGEYDPSILNEVTLTASTWDTLKKWCVEHMPEITNVNHAGNALMLGLCEVGKFGDRPSWAQVYNAKISVADAHEAIMSHYANKTEAETAQ